MSRKSLIFWSAISLLPLLGVAWNIFQPTEYDVARRHAIAYVQSAGAFGPLVFVALQIAQVVITPINHYVVGILGGFLFGPIVGGLYNWVGRVLGHLLAFYLARRYGRRLVERFAPEHDLEKYDRLVGDRPFVLFLIYFLPFFPDDELSYMVGLSRMRARAFAAAAVLGHIGGSWSLSYVGAGVKTYDPFFWVLVGLTVAGFPLVAWLIARKRVNNV